MTTQEFLSKLKNVRTIHGGWQAICPAHRDIKPSLSVSEGKGKILLKCQAGCETPAVVAALGLSMSDLFAEPKQKPNGHGRRIVAAYDYKDENGALLFQVVRYDPKAFSQRRPDGKGGWIWNLKGVLRVLCNLPEVLKAKAVLIVEGEKDVERVRELDFVATCNPRGAGKWRPEYCESLRGKWAAIICDADPPGLAHGRDVARSLLGVAGMVWLTEALPQSKDFSEWVEHGGTHAALVEVLKRTPRLTRADVAEWNNPSVAVPGVLASEIKPQRVRWLWQNYIPLGKVTLFDGDPGLAKSTASLDLAARISRGRAMPDGTWSGCEPAGAVAVSLEDGKGDTIRPRLEAAGADLNKVRVVTTVPGLDGIERTPTLPADLPYIEAAIQNVKTKLVIFDPLMGVLGGETNSYRDQDVRRALAPVAEMAERTGVAVIFVRHLNKGGGQNAKYRGGGSIGIIGASRASFLFGEKPSEETRFVFAPVKGNLWRGKLASLEYTIRAAQMEIDGETTDQPVIEWGGPSAHTATSLLVQPEGAEESNALADARNFLEEFLRDGPREADEVFREAKKAKVSDRTLYRAKASLGVRSRKEGIGDGQHWAWALPNIAKEPPKIAKPGNLATFGGGDGNLRGQYAAGNQPESMPESGPSDREVL